MFFPTRTDRRIKRTPWVNYALIGANILVFLFTERAIRAGAAGIEAYFLIPLDPSIEQFITYQFLHADKLHILFNMLFLYVFGNAVEDRLGRAGYLLFYLAGGVVAGLGHCRQRQPGPGRSGSVAAVTGAYLALFPLSNVTIVYWFFVIGSFEVSSMLLILFRVGQDLFFQLGSVGKTAYVAHLAGYAVGFAIGMGLLLSRVLPREPCDMLALIEQRRRRGQFRRLTRRGYQPWEASSRTGAPDAAAEESMLSADDARLMADRARVSESFDRHDLPAAAAAYTDLLERHPGQVLAQQQQLDVANQLMSDGRYDGAATAYELFLQHYPRYPERHHVKLILGLIHGRYLGNPARARELLADAQPHLTGDDQSLARAVLAELP